MAAVESTDALPEEWARRVRRLREQQGMAECRCGRFYQPETPEQRRCRDCR